jgi:hypothetical protein
MGQYLFNEKFESIDAISEEKLPEKSSRGHVDFIFGMCRNSMQKERKDKNAFSEII